MNILQYQPMGNYPLWVNMLTTFAYLPTCALYVFPMSKYRPDIVTPEARAVPQRVWLIMGTLDSIAGVMQSFATAYLSNDGALVVLLLQSAIPSSMVITKLFLKTKYKVYQYSGATLVIVGILVVLVPQLVSGVSGVQNVGVWASVLVLSCVPMCLSSVYKEKALGDTGMYMLWCFTPSPPQTCVHSAWLAEIDAIYMNFWVAVYQFIIGFPLLIPMGYASQPAMNPSEMWDNLGGGAKCYAGINTLPSDDCRMGPVFVNVYILFNLAYNVLIILMLKYGSSNILWLCFTLQVPIANFAFAIPGMPGYKPVTWENGLGLVIIMGGLVIYRFYTPLRALIYRRLGWSLTAPVPHTELVDAYEQGHDAPLLEVDGASPGTLGGSTPVRGMHTHVTRSHGKGAAAKKAEVLAAARAKLDAPTNKATRARGDSQ
jgi:hypothetical protein